MVTDSHIKKKNLKKTHMKKRNQVGFRSVFKEGVRCSYSLNSQCFHCKL